MAIKLTLLGALIYVTMALWAAALAAYLSARNKPGMASVGSALFAAGSAVMLAAFALRWEQVQHPPFQNMFEVFLALGMLMWPLWEFCRQYLGARGPAVNVLVGIIVLFPAGFVFHADPEKLPPALQSWLFVPHVGAYMIAYVVLLLAAAQAAMHLADGHATPLERQRYELATYNMIRLGFPLLTLGLVLGAVWGKLAWGDYWNWDPKELWSLTSWLAYVSYLHVRSLCGSARPRLASALAILGGVLVIVTLLWVNLADKMFKGGMHVYAS